MRKIGERILYQGNWLALKEARFQAEDGREIRWESVERRASRTVLVVIARLFPSDRIVLIRQYRPAVERWILGFPAGIWEGGPLEDAAMAELKEETGYQGRVVATSMPLKLNSGIMDEDLYVLDAEVDEMDPVNEDPHQELEPEEEIQVVAVERTGIALFLAEEAARGVQIAAGLWYAFRRGSHYQRCES
ncbi:MAG: NUDIX hydrolase [Coprothermobacterota bacterium]|nr:NUDIX hydrolase [Coprothermobacterota bacterium]